MALFVRKGGSRHAGQAALPQRNIQTGHRQDWGQIHSQLEIYFEDRLAGRNL